MAFVGEEISAEDFRAINWSDFDDYKNDSMFLPTYWVIDRRRNVFFWLIHRQIHTDPKWKFGIWLGAEVRYISAVKVYLNFLVEGENFCEAGWDKIRILNESQCDQWSAKDIKNLVKEALEAYGDGLNPPSSAKVRMTFI